MWLRMVSSNLIFLLCANDKSVWELRPKSRETLQSGYLANLMLTNYRAEGMIIVFDIW